MMQLMIGNTTWNILRTFGNRFYFLKKFNEDPLKVHLRVDLENNKSIEARYFGIWLNLWYDKLDTYYEGSLVELAKNRARKMETKIMISIFEGRSKV